MKSFAVVMNMKARKARKGTLDMLRKHVDVEDLYITHTVEQSDQSLDEIIKKRYPIVFCGGGDGTAMRIMEQMHKKVAAHNAKGGDYQVPRFGLLKLGTGNGWAGLLQVPPKVAPIWAMRQVRSAEELSFTTFNMIESEGRLFHFGGFGVDGLILNDYITLKKILPKKGFLWKLSNSLMGYLMAILLKSIPHVALKGSRMNVRVINESSDPVYRASHKGGIVDSGLKKGDTIYEGRTLIVGIATTANYGFNMKIYPFANARRGYMHLRLCETSVPNILAHIVPIWKGVWQHPTLHDFLVKEVRVELEKDAPFQLGGDPEGYRKECRFRVDESTVDVLDFRKQK